jgi:pyruvate/2-oxoacid:ferredoxin oxidoreductase alpha subunit
VHDEFAKIFGRRYDPWVEEFMTDDAEVVFFLQGARGDGAFAIQHMRDRGLKVGMVRLRTIRPYPTDRVKDVLSKFKVVGVIETNMGIGSVSSGGVLYAEVCALLRKPEAPAGAVVHGGHGRRGHRAEGILLDDGENDGRAETAREDRKAHALGWIRRVAE